MCVLFSKLKSGFKSIDFTLRYHEHSLVGEILPYRGRDVSSSLTLWAWGEQGGISSIS